MENQPLPAAAKPQWYKNLRWQVAVGIGVFVVLGILGTVNAYQRGLLTFTDTPKESVKTADTGQTTDTTEPSDSNSAPVTEGKKPEQPKTTAPTQPAKTVEDTGAFTVTTKTAFSCSAKAPDDWSIQSNQEANSADLYSADHSSYAGYGIQAVNEQLAPYAGAYQAPLNNPDLYSSDPGTVVQAYVGIIASALGESSGASYTGDVNEAVGDFTLRSFSAGGHKGVVFYYTNGFPGDGVNYSYIEPFYVAAVPNSASAGELDRVARVASSINCTTQVVQHDGPLVKAQLSDHTRASGGSTDSSSSGGYNVQLGTEYVHDSAGNNYLVSNTDNWSSTGPDGAGYYASKSGGNSYEKLQAGFQ